MKLLRLITMICLLASGGIYVQANASAVFDCDGRLFSTMAYDNASSLSLAYDGASVLLEGNRQDHSTFPCNLFGQFSEFLAAEGGAYSAIGSTGQVGEQWLAQNLGGESQVFFNTTQGGRYVDQLVGDVANESKVGYQSLTPTIQLQIAKDAELLNGGTLQGVNWHFFQSPVTGLGGPSQPLLNALQQNGINVIIH